MVLETVPKRSLWPTGTNLCVCLKSRQSELLLEVSFFALGATFGMYGWARGDASFRGMP